jgi:alpha-tubulin suppressor-like RCC1 family protein
MVSAGTDHSCGVSDAGAAYCWGSNFSGALGDGSKTNRTTPVAVTGGLAFRSVSAGSAHSCGVTVANEAWCWGRNDFGGLGIGAADTLLHPAPVRVSGGLAFAYVGAGSYSSCGLTTSGRVYCWGRPNGLGSTSTETCVSPVSTQPQECVPRPTPIASDLTFTALAVAPVSVCAIATTGAIYCWGTTATPTLVNGAPPFRTVATAYYGEGCGLTIYEIVYCWDQTLTAKKAPGQP